MSKIAIKGNESGTATFTIEAPATNTDRTFSLPDEAGKVLTTGNNDPAEVFKQANILGTVSQSGGVPTGAIIERGSNANGEFVKYADGTMICTLSRFDPGAQIPTFRDWSYPAAFIHPPQVTATPAGAGDVESRRGSKINVGVTQNSGSFLSRHNENKTRIYFDPRSGWNSTSGNWSSHLSATGRWF